MTPTLKTLSMRHLRSLASPFARRAAVVLRIVRQRPATASLFLMSLLLLIFVPFLAYHHIVAIDLNSSYVGIDAAPLSTLSLVRVDAEYNGGSGDRLGVSVWLRADDRTVFSDGDSELVLTVPRRLVADKDGSFLSCMYQYSEAVHEDFRWLYYKLKRADSCSGGEGGLTQNFTGNLFQASLHELWLDLRVQVTPVATEVEARVLGMDKVALDTVLPEPTSRTASGLLYRWSAIDQKGGELGPVVVRGIDREQSSRLAVVFFGSGILCGVLASIVAAVVLDSVRSWEATRRRAR